jgi:PAS domain-containing protein
MNISDEDTGRVVRILENSLHGLSISELSRQSGINRNKVAAISETLAREGLLTCTCRYRSKIYSLRFPSPVHALLENIPEPALIVDENLILLRINPAYAAMFQAEEAALLSQPFTAIPGTPFAGLATRLHNHLEEGREGERRVHRDETGTDVCTSIRIPFPGEHHGLLLILHQGTKAVEEQEQKDRLLQTLILLSRELPGISRTATLEESFSALAGLIGRSYPESLIFTILVDEPGQRGRFTSVHAGQAQKRTRESLENLPGEQCTISIPDRTMTEYKTGRILTEEVPGDLFGPETVSVELRSAEAAFSRYTIATIGIIENRSLIGIVGMGTPRITGTPGGIHQVLSSIAGFFETAGMSSVRTREISRLTEEFQARYRDVYTLLSKKAETEILHAAQADRFRRLAGILADFHNLPLLITDRERAVLHANQTALQTFRIRERDLAEPVRIQTIMPEELAGFLMESAEREESQWQEGEPAIVTGVIHGTAMTWCMAGDPGDPASGILVFIGEKNPATRIRDILNKLRDGF